MCSQEERDRNVHDQNEHRKIFQHPETDILSNPFAELGFKFLIKNFVLVNTTEVFTALTPKLKL